MHYVVAKKNSFFLGSNEQKFRVEQKVWCKQIEDKLFEGKQIEEKVIELYCSDFSGIDDLHRKIKKNLSILFQKQK